MNTWQSAIKKGHSNEWPFLWKQLNYSINDERQIFCSFFEYHLYTAISKCHL